MIRNNLTISVITVTMNCAETIERALKSLYSQTYQHIEHVVIDGGSTDGTLDIIERYSSRMAYFVSEPDDGIYNAMNKGIQAAQGDILFFLNSDDYLYDSTVLDSALGIFNSDKDIAIVYGDIIRVKGNDLLLKQYSDKSIERLSLARNTIGHQAIFARKTVFDETGLFDETYKIASDFDWLVKAVILLKYNAHYINKIISVYSSKGTSAMTFFESERLKITRKYFSCYEVFRFRIIPKYPFIIEHRILNSYPITLKVYRLMIWPFKKLKLLVKSLKA